MEEPYAPPPSPGQVKVAHTGEHLTISRCRSTKQVPAREFRQGAPKAQTVQTKHLLQTAVGMDSNAFLRHVYEGSIAAYAILPALASFLAHLAQAKATLQAMIQQGMPFYQPDARINNRNWATFALEAAESFVMRRGQARRSSQCL